jgi:hypothetical protein
MTLLKSFLIAKVSADLQKATPVLQERIKWLKAATLRRTLNEMEL